MKFRQNYVIAASLLFVAPSCEESPRKEKDEVVRRMVEPPLAQGHIRLYDNSNDMIDYELVEFRNSKVLVELPKDRNEAAKVGGYIQHDRYKFKISPTATGFSDCSPIINRKARSEIEKIIRRKGHLGEIIFRESGSQ